MSTDSKPILKDEDVILAEVHQRREMVLDVLLPPGIKTLPSDPDDRKIVLALLKDMSADALGRKRIKVDEKANDALAGSAAMIAQLLDKAAQRQAGHRVTPGTSREVPVLGSEVPPPRLVEGETAAVGVSESYESFTARTAGGGGQVPVSAAD